MISARATESATGSLLRFKELTRLLYELRRAHPRLCLLGASVVHPRHPIPKEHLEIMSLLTEQAREQPGGGLIQSPGTFHIATLIEMARRWMICLLSAFLTTLKIIYLKSRFWREIRQICLEPASVLMKTWCSGPESVKGQSDFYYGNLGQLLGERGVSCLLLCHDLRDRKEVAFAQAALKNNHTRCFPERLLIPIWAPVVTACRQLMTSLDLCRVARRSKDEKFALICARTSLDCLRPFTTMNVMYFYIAKMAVKIWKAKVFVALFEGHPWEQLVWHGVKEADRECRTVGYQHTVIMPHALSLTWPNQGSWELSVPDVVLCLGEVTKNMMKPGHESHGTKLIPFGSFRRNSGNPMPRPPMPERRTVLVLPEGLVDEEKLLFNFAIRLASLLPDHCFIFRCHPLLPFARIRSLLEGIPEEFPNIQISNYHSIEDDFTRSSAVLYRGSSAVLYAVLHGMKPIYLHDDDYSDVDPLFEVNSWRESVSSTREMENVLRRYAETTTDCASKQWRSAAEYVNSYTMPVEEASIDRFLEGVGLLSRQPTI